MSHAALKRNSDLSQRNQTLEKESSEWRTRYQVVKQQLDQTADIRKLKRKVKQLELLSEEYLVVVRRFIVTRAREELMRIARAQGIHYKDFDSLTETLTPRWRLQHGLTKAAVKLLRKGDGTPFDHGCIAGHDNDQHVAQHAADTAPSKPLRWARLYKFIFPDAAPR
jgi:hypothetical protein